MSRRVRSSLVLALSGLATSCGGTTEPEEPLRLAFSAPSILLGLEREGFAELRNPGARPVQLVELTARPVRDGAGLAVPGARVTVDPAQISRLEAGMAVPVRLVLELPDGIQAGLYDSSLQALATGVQATLEIRFEVAAPPDVSGPLTVVITTDPGSVRQGDVVAFAARVNDPSGAIVPGAAVAWSVVPPEGGLFGPNGQFVGYRAGDLRVVAAAEEAADTLSISVARRLLSGSFAVVGRGEESTRFTSDLWLHGNHAYTGTWGVRSAAGAATPGNALYTWDVSDPALPRRTATLTVDARTVNDVKVSANGRMAMITHEGSSDGLNGVTVLDLTNPAQPRATARFTDGLENGVHNVWLEGEYAYVVADGEPGGMRVLDVSDPGRPRAVADFHAGSSFLHDVYVRDGLAFLSHWNAGLVIVDVGNGIAGGSPTNPTEVSRVDLGGQTHNAWYWPAAGYAFVGEEDFNTPGIVHVVDVRNPRQPREVATFAVPGTAPHNFWLDEERAVLFIGWYVNGLRALDVSGELMGDLGLQGREIASSLYNGTDGGCRDSGTCTWAPQLHRGIVWVSDMNSGLVALSFSY